MTNTLSFSTTYAVTVDGAREHSHINPVERLMASLNSTEIKHPLWVIIWNFTRNEFQICGYHRWKYKQTFLKESSRWPYHFISGVVFMIFFGDLIWNPFQYLLVNTETKRSSRTDVVWPMSNSTATLLNPFAAEAQLICHKFVWFCHRTRTGKQPDWVDWDFVKHVGYSITPHYRYCQ